MRSAEKIHLIEEALKIFEVIWSFLTTSEKELLHIVMTRRLALFPLSTDQKTQYWGYYLNN
jgi:hypothetical protein